MKNSYLTVTDDNDKTEELESNAKYIRVWGYSINVRNTHVCYMNFDFVRTFHKVKYFWYGICGVSVPIFYMQVSYY